MKNGAFFIDSDDKLWAGSVYRGSGIDVIDMKTKSVTNHVPPNARMNVEFQCGVQLKIRWPNMGTYSIRSFCI